MSDSRTYRSPLRESQTEQTRLLILDTLAEIAAEDGFGGIVVKDIAKRAGIAPRTIYRHFADRDALHDALADRISDSEGWGEANLGPHSEWPQVVESAYNRFDAHEVASTVAARLNDLRRGTASDSARRRDSFRQSVREEFPNLTDSDLESVLGVVLLVASSRSWLRMKDELGMSGERSGPIMRWILELVVADLNERGAVPSYNLDPDDTAPTD